MDLPDDYESSENDVPEYIVDGYPTWDPKHGHGYDKSIEDALEAKIEATRLEEEDKRRNHERLQAASLFGSGLTGFIKEKIFDAIFFGGFGLVFLIILFLSSATRRSPDQPVQQQQHKSVHHQQHHR